MKLPTRVAVTAVTLTVAAVTAVAGCGSGSGSGTSSGTRSGAKKAAAAAAATPLGSYPSFLPASTLHQPTDSVLTGTAQRPALAQRG